jgi:uncharacterized protein
MTWIQTNNGRRFDFLDPRPSQIDIRDIALALARIPRFGAKTRQTKHTYSVAQHSVLVSHLCPRRLALAGLLHDATEGILGFDMPTPIKDVLREFRALEQAIDQVIFEKYRIPWDHMAEIKPYDLAAMQIEKRCLMDLEPEPWETVWPLSDEQVAAAGEVVPLPWHQARVEFLRRFGELGEVSVFG